MKEVAEREKKASAAVRLWACYDVNDLVDGVMAHWDCLHGHRCMLAWTCMDLEPYGGHSTIGTAPACSGSWLQLLVLTGCLLS